MPKDPPDPTMPVVELMGGIALSSIIRDLTFDNAASTNGTIRRCALCEGKPDHHEALWSLTKAQLITSKIFLPEDDATLVIEAEVQKRLDSPDPPLFRTSGKLTHFGVLILPDVQLAQLNFNSVSFTAEPGKKLDTDVDLKGIEFLGILKFVDKLREIMPMDGFSDPPSLERRQRRRPRRILPRHSHRRRRRHDDAEHQSFRRLLPAVHQRADELPLRLLRAAAAVHAHGVALGGGGFVAINLGLKGVKSLEAALEFGASIALNLGVAAGAATIMAGFYFQMATGNGFQLTGYFRACGELSVPRDHLRLGRVLPRPDLRVQGLADHGGKLWGQASLTVKIKILFFSKSVGISMERVFAGSDPTSAIFSSPPTGVCIAIPSPITHWWREIDMLKQTIVWTALPHRSDGPIKAKTKLLVSAFVAAALDQGRPVGHDDAAERLPRFSRLAEDAAGATFEVAFEGGPTLPATIVKTPRPPRSDLWNSLFKDTTLVIPFGFEDLTGADSPSFSSTRIYDKIREAFQRAATNHSGDLPHRSVLAKDPVLVDIARPRDPQKPYIPEKKDTGPVFVGTHGPEDPGPDIVPTPGWRRHRKRLRRLHRLSGRAVGTAAPLAQAPRAPGRVALHHGRLRRRLDPKRRSGETRRQRRRLIARSSLANECRIRTAAGVREAAERDLEKMPEKDDLPATYDFHQMVSSLGDYPNLLRYFGLVVDLEVTIGADLPPATGMLSVIPTLPLAMVTTNYTPRTHYELGDGVFLTQSRPGGDLNNGLLRADDTSRFRILQLDVAGSGIKMQSTATTIVSQETLDEWAGNEPEEQGLPYLQTAGISLVRPELAVDLKASFFNSWALNAKLAAIDGSPSAKPEGPELDGVTDEIWAEDALRGYRVDVFDDQSKQWHPLCHRVGKYTFDEAPGGLLELKDEEDEGFVQLAVTEPLNQDPDKRELRVHESLFTWNGWSLAAPRFGNTILPTEGHEAEVGSQQNTPRRSSSSRRRSCRRRSRCRGCASAIATNCAPASSISPATAPSILPTRAFGVTQTEVTPEEKFRRFEPVAPPMVMLQREPIAGESLERLVVRSVADNTPAPVTVPTTVRHFVPPKTSQLMAERHRKFDGTPAIDGTIDGYKLAAREAGTLMETVDPLSGARTPIPGADEVKAPLPADSDPVKPPPPPHTYWLQRNDAFELPYLPDPSRSRRAPDRTSSRRCVPPHHLRRKVARSETVPPARPGHRRRSGARRRRSGIRPPMRRPAASSPSRYRRGRPSRCASAPGSTPPISTTWPSGAGRKRRAWSGQAKQTARSGGRGRQLAAPSFPHARPRSRCTAAIADPDKSKGRRGQAGDRRHRGHAHGTGPGRRQEHGEDRSAGVMERSDR